MCIGSICGDIAGSRYEGIKHQPKSDQFYLYTKYTKFTDDSVLSIALCDAILSQENDQPIDYASKLKDYYKRYPNRGYGKTFRAWANGDEKSNNSFGNGAPMRVSPVAWAFQTLEEVIKQAELSASVTHNSEEGIKGAKAIAGSIFIARKGYTKTVIKGWVEDKFKYVLKPCSEYKYEFHSSSQETVPQAISAFLESNSFVEAVRNGVKVGGDSDTIACMAGAIAEAYYCYIPDCVLRNAYRTLSDDLREVLCRFLGKYVDPKQRLVYRPELLPKKIENQEVDVSNLFFI